MMRLGEKDARVRVAWEALSEQALARRKGSHADALGDVGWCSCEPFAKRSSIQRREREYTDTALMTARAARKMRTGTLGGGGKRYVDDGEEFVHRSAVSV